MIVIMKRNYCNKNHYHFSTLSSSSSSSSSSVLVVLLQLLIIINIVLSCCNNNAASISTIVVVAAAAPTIQQQQHSSSSSRRHRNSIISTSNSRDIHKSSSVIRRIVNKKNNNNNNNNAAILATASSTSSTTASNNAWIHGIKSGCASAGSAFCVKTLLQPIDAIKTVQQYSIFNISVIEACKQLISRPGSFLNFYSGLGITVFGAMPGVALYFGVYSYCKQRLLVTKFGKQHKTTSIALSAAMGNSIASFSRVPYEVMKQKLQAGLYTNTVDIFKDLIHKPGMVTELMFPPGGILVQMVRDIPYAVVTLLLYESLQQWFNNTNNDGTTTANNNNNNKKVLDFILGGIAGGIGSWITNPMDVIKTRLQTDSSIYNGSVILCTKTIWSEGGINAFLRGSVPRLMHKIPANAFFFLFYEFFKRILNVQQQTTEQVVPTTVKK